MNQQLALVTGATGLVGSHVVRSLLRSGYGVRVVVRRGSDLRALEGLDVEVVRGDVFELDGLSRAAIGTKFIFHVASVFSYVVSAEEQLRVALVGAENALRAAKQAKCARVVLSASSVVFGAHRSTSPRDETCAPGEEFDNQYQASKVAQWRATQHLASELGIDCVAACPTVVIGAHDYRLNPSNALLVNYLRDPFRSTFPGGCNLVDARDVGDGHVLLAERGERGAAYILGSENLEYALIHRMTSELCGTPGPRFRANHTSSYLAALGAELVASFSGTQPVLTRAQVRAVGKYYWYSSERARALGYRPRPSRAALVNALGWLLQSAHVSRELRYSLRPTLEVTRASAPNESTL